LQSAIRSMKAENRDKWTQVKKAFAISKEVNQKAMDLLKEEAVEKEEALRAVTTELDDFKGAAASALMLIRMAQRVSAVSEDSIPSDNVDDLAATLTTAALALYEQMGELHMRYTQEFEEAWKLRASSSNNNSSSSSNVLEALTHDIGPSLGKYLHSPPVQHIFIQFLPSHNINNYSAFIYFTFTPVPPAVRKAWEKEVSLLESKIGGKELYYSRTSRVLCNVC
jgi:hypothetical protein